MPALLRALLAPLLVYGLDDSLPVLARSPGAVLPCQFALARRGIHGPIGIPDVGHD
jgi:hypothetical protein